jgi:hypothetical protein
MECALVAQHLLPPPATSDRILHVVWRSTAERVSVRGAVLLLMLGLGGVAVRVITDRFTIVGRLGILSTAFACYAMITQPSDAHPTRAPRVTRILAGTLKVIATVAGLATGLLLLAAVFGGSLEVMRLATIASEHSRR